MPFLYALVLIFSAIIRLHDAVSYNPLWGYDGGAHLAYLRILQTFHRLPTPSETYLAWHEPLYYLLASLTNGAGLRIFQALLGVIFVAAVGRLAYIMTDRRAVALLTMTIFAVLPPAVLLSIYPTNELLAQTLFIVILMVAIQSLRGGRRAVLLGLLLAAAQLTKLSAVTVVAAVAFALVLARRWRSLVVALGIWLLLSAPWQIYRAARLGGVFRINNVEKTTLIARTKPLKFFVWFDRGVFHDPFWPSGSGALWSTLHGQTVADYDVMIGNPDRDVALPRDQTILTGSGRYVSLARWAANFRLARWSVAFLPLIAFGFVEALRRARDPRTFLPLAFVATSLAALVWNVTRYPYLERGTLKPIFILAALTIPFIWGFDAFLRRGGRPALVLAGGITALFVALAVPVVWITNG